MIHAPLRALIFFSLTISGTMAATQKRYVSSETIASLCKTIHSHAMEVGFEPELIIGLSRGGLVPLCYLAGERMFNNRNVKIIGIASYNDEGTQSTLQLVSPLFDEDMEYLKKYSSILIVDDLVDSGKTLSFVVRLLRTALPHTTIKTATLFYKKNGLFKPDFYAEVTKDWIVFPWESE